jgi:serine/threonine protein phosphatase PrpC
MTTNYGLEFAALSDIGLIRSNNEDAIAIKQEYGLAILADGMGGHNAGEVASNMATEVIQQSLTARLQHATADTESDFSEYLQSWVSDAIGLANTYIHEASSYEAGCSGMGTTVVLALHYKDRFTIAHVGDSRAYRFRQGQLEQLTRDHSWLQEQIDAGLIAPETARFSSNKNLITRALGSDPYVEAELHDYRSQAGDIILLCSDGLNDMVSDQLMCDVLSCGGQDLHAACKKLIQLANDSGGRDNASVVLVKVQNNS